MVISAIQHRRFVVSLPAIDLPQVHNVTFPIALSCILGALGFLLAIYLAL